MPLGFGFGVSDFIASIGVLRGILKALSDSSGSSKEYLGLINELWSLESALIQVKAQYNKIEQQQQRLALEQAATACESTIDIFPTGLTR